MKKILIFTAGYFPGKKYGGPPVSVDNFCSLMSEFKCFIVAKNHDLGDKNPYKDINCDWNSRSNCEVKYLDDSCYKYKTFLAITDEIKPDFIYLQGVFQSCIIPCLQIAKKRKISVVLAPRGELCKGAINSSIIKHFKKTEMANAFSFLIF